VRIFSTRLTKKGFVVSSTSTIPVEDDSSDKEKRQNKLPGALPLSMFPWKLQLRLTRGESIPTTEAEAELNKEEVPEEEK
jgi:hypothetical protein